MITKQDIKKLQEHQGYPCVSIFIETHKTMPDRMQDPIRVKDMIKEAGQKLSSELQAKEASCLITALDNLAANIDYTKSLAGLALFVSYNLAESFILPFKVSPKIVIDQIFATKELIDGMAHTISYWVLSISHKPARLFKGEGEHFEEILDDLELQMNMKGFPFKLNYDVTSDREKLAYGVGDSGSSYISHLLDQFMHQLDDLLSIKIKDEHLPLVIMGTQKNRAAFEQITKFKNNIIIQIEGDYTDLTVPEIEKLIKPYITDYIKEEEIKTINYLNEAIGKDNHVFGIIDVWRKAHAGQIRILIIEENYMAPAYVDENNPDEVILYDKSNTPGGYKDLTDDIVSKVFHSKGKVLFVKEGLLSNFEKIAAILWY